MKANEIPFIEKCILTILFVNLLCKFSEICESYSLSFTTNK